MTEHARIIAPISLPSGEGDTSKRAFINLQFTQPVQLAVEQDDGIVVITPLGELPEGTRELYVQHRLCGDYYCFIHSAKQVAAIGPTAADAFQNALKLAA